MTDGLQKAIQAAGSAAALADILEIRPQAISQWKRIPAERCRPISEATGIPLAELRPDLFGPAENSAA